MDEGSISLRNWTAELVKLHHLLQFASNDFRNKSGADRRPGIRVVLHGLSEFVGNVFPIDQGFSVPLNELRYALYDLDRGKVVGLLDPSKVGHRPPDPVAKALFIASAAALMNLYQHMGMSRELAARQTATKLNELGYRDEAGDRITAKRVENWRDRMKEREGEKNDIAAGRYAALVSDLMMKQPSEAEKAAECLLAALPEMIPPGIPTNPSS